MYFDIIYNNTYKIIMNYYSISYRFNILTQKFSYDIIIAGHCTFTLKSI